MLKKILGGIVALVIVGAIWGGGGDDTSSNDDTTTYAEEAVKELEQSGDITSEDVEEVADEEPVKKTKKPKPEPKYTSGQENAIAKAQDYLSYSAFSKSGLVKQLKFEGFKAKDAAFAVNHIKVNWNQQAVAKAKDYMSYSSFSKQGLIDQLKFEGFTPAQATFGANKAY